MGCCTMDAASCARFLVGDSVALLHILIELQQLVRSTWPARRISIMGFRGADAEADEEFCRSLAASLDVEIQTRGRGDVGERARAAKSVLLKMPPAAPGTSLLGSRAAGRTRNAIAVGHSLDDGFQAETFLLRVIRGAGTRGLGGIRQRAGNVIRPLIEIRRSDLRAYAPARRLAHREDATNLDVEIARNRIRHELIPLSGAGFFAGYRRGAGARGGDGAGR